MKQFLYLLGTAFFCFLVLVFAIRNYAPVELVFFSAKIQGPLAVVCLSFFAVGAALGFLLGVIPLVLEKTSSRKKRVPLPATTSRVLVKEGGDLSS